MNYEFFNGMTKVSTDNNVAEVKCDEDNHIYSNWYEKECFSNYKGSTFKNKVWCRRCIKCGNIDFTFVKPVDYIKNNEKKLIREK